MSETHAGNPPEGYHHWRLGKISNCCWKTQTEFPSATTTITTQKAILGLLFIVFLVICVACYLTSTLLIIPDENDHLYDQYLSIGDGKKYWINGLKTTKINTIYYKNNRNRKQHTNKRTKGKSKKKITDKIARENDDKNIQLQLDALGLSRNTHFDEDLKYVSYHCFLFKSSYNAWSFKFRHTITALFKFQTPSTMLQNFKNPCWAEKTTDNILQLRCFPYFYLAGFPKSGTTDLYNEIIKHPMIAQSIQKEPHWWTKCRFDRNRR